jgi:hypothetical protein
LREPHTEERRKEGGAGRRNSSHGGTEEEGREAVIAVALCLWVRTVKNVNAAVLP